MSTLSVNNVTEVGGAPVVTNGVLDSGSLPTGTILQVVSTTKNDTFSTTSTSFVDVTGLSASITPSSASNKILVLVNINLSNSQTTGATTSGQILRDATAISNNATYDRSMTMATVDTGGNRALEEKSVTYLDSPASVSALTYKVQVKVGSDTGYVNRAGNSAVTSGVSSITLMEVAG